ncbi:MAG: mltB [Rhizobacter sp.]|nr:mltB [Rhizobacter sp.]
MTTNARLALASALAIVAMLVSSGSVFSAVAAATGNAEPLKKGKAQKAKAKLKSKDASAPPRADNSPEIVTYGGRADVMGFAADLAARRQLDPTFVANALAKARYQPSVARFIMPAATGAAKNWAAYRARFVEPIRQRAGVEFWRANRRWLEQAEAAYGVPPEIVVGIIGVETIYGRQMGNFRVIDALATLSFDFPSGRSDRAPFFRDELENLLVMASRHGVDPLNVVGSYAGAMGMPQFMPSSINQYAVDFDGDGRIDLANSAADVIGSVARYLATFGWQRGVPTRFNVMAPNDTVQRATLLVPDILPTFTAEQFAGFGATLSPPGRAFTGPLALVEVQNGDMAPSYWAGTQNFYAITRYNWSSYYALAVIELGESVKAIVMVDR